MYYLLRSSPISRQRSVKAKRRPSRNKDEISEKNEVIEVRLCAKALDDDYV